MNYKLPIGVTVVGALIVVLIGVMGWYGIPKIIDNQISKQTRLEPESETFEKWADVPYPIYLSFRVFHVTNPDEVEQGEVPIFEEKGPYHYKQTRKKGNVTQNDPYDPEFTIQYKEYKTYFFDAEKSGSSTEDDIVNVINLPFVALINGVHDQMAGLEKLISRNINMTNERLIRRNVKVGDLLFKGMDVQNYLDVVLLGTIPLEPLLPPEFSEGKFGLYKGENGTASLEYDVFTGVADHEEFGLIKTFNGSAQLGYWVGGTECDKVKGTDGSIYPPFLTKDRKIDVFSSDLCRSLTFTYRETVDYKDIEAYRFTVPKKTLEDPRINKENVCYCLEDDLEKCPHAGAMSLSGCRNGAPIMMSTPYFLDGYEGYYIESGLNTLKKANEEEHLTYLDIEPRSGVLLQGHKRIQVNIEVKVFNGVKQYGNLKKDMVFPIVWADESAEMDDENADEIKSKLFKPVKIVNIVKWVVLGVGVVVIVLGAVLFVLQRRRLAKETV